MCRFMSIWLTQRKFSLIFRRFSEQAVNICKTGNIWDGSPAQRAYLRHTQRGYCRCLLQPVQRTEQHACRIAAHCALTKQANNKQNLKNKNQGKRKSPLGRLSFQLLRNPVTYPPPPAKAPLHLPCGTSSEQTQETDLSDLASLSFSPACSTDRQGDTLQKRSPTDCPFSRHGDTEGCPEAPSTGHAEQVSHCAQAQEYGCFQV